MLIRVGKVMMMLRLMVMLIMMVVVSRCTGSGDGGSCIYDAHAREL